MALSTVTIPNRRVSSSVGVIMIYFHVVHPTTIHDLSLFRPLSLFHNFPRLKFIPIISSGVTLLLLDFPIRFRPTPPRADTKVYETPDSTFGSSISGIKYTR